MEKIAFAGTFDPVTNGHLWVIKEALNLAQEVVVIIAVNSSKKPLFSDSTRKEMMEKAVATLPDGHRVTVKILKNEYVAQAALDNFNCQYLIRGIRGAMEFDYEALIQKTNTDILYGAKTLFVMPPRDLEAVSSSFVKSLVGPIGWHWYMKKFVPEYVYRYWLEQYITAAACDIFDNHTVAQFVVDIKAHYNEPTRHYHNMEHLAHCLQELQWLMLNTEQDLFDMKKLCIALLGHDVIYGAHDPEKSDEELSSQYTYHWLVANSVMSEEDAFEVKSLIEKTQYLSKNMKLQTPLEKLICSIDLSVLSKNEEIYHLYKDNIKKEYPHVELNVYKAERAKALKKLLQIPALYEAPEFAHYEARARKNLNQEIMELTT